MHVLAFAASLLLAAQPHKPKIAVLDVQDVTGNQAADARALTQIVTGEVARDGSLEVISSDQIRQMLGFEKQKQLLGCNESSCLAEIGGALGVDDLLTGQLSKIGSHYRLDLSVIDQEKARTVATVGELLPAEEDALVSAAVPMVNELLQKAKLRSGAPTDSPALDAAISQPAPAVPHGAKVAFSVSGGLAIGAAVMTVLTYLTFQSAKKNDGQASDRAYSNLKWMGPVTDCLWGGAIVAAGTGMVLKLTAKPTGSGGEIGLAGSF